MAATSVLLLLTCNVFATYGHALVNPAEEGFARTPAKEEPPDEGQLAVNIQPNESPDELLNQLQQVLSSVSQNSGTPSEETAGDLASAISAMTAAVVASSARVDQQIMQLRKDNTAQIEAAVLAVQESFASLSSIATIAMENQAAVASLEKSVAQLQELVNKQRHLAAEEGVDESFTNTPPTITFPTHATLERTRKMKKKLELVGGMSHVDISVTNIVIPEQVFIGGSALLECLWTGYPIYSLRWYKDDENIFTIIPGADDKRAYDGIPGVFVDIESSDMEILVLRDINEHTSGLYKCEVVGEAPQFQTIDVQQELTVQASTTPAPTQSITIAVESTSVPQESSTHLASLPEKVVSTSWCEEPGFIVGDSCFRIYSSERKSWQDARKFCQDQGTKLAMPSYVRWFSKYLRERPNKEGKGRFWLDASHEENGWQWDSTKNSKQGKIKFPSTSFEGECLFIAPYAKTILKSRACKSSEAFICQYHQPQEVLIPITRSPEIISTIASLESSESDIPSTSSPIAIPSLDSSESDIPSTTSPVAIPSLESSESDIPSTTSPVAIPSLESSESYIPSTTVPIAITDSPELEISISSTTQPILTDGYLELSVNKSTSIHLAPKTVVEKPIRPIFTECKSPYFQLGTECFMIHLTPYARHEIESVCSSANGSFLAEPSNISALRDYIYKLQDLDYQVDYWLGCWAWVPNNTNIPGEELLPQNHNWCVAFTPKQCPYLSIDQCHNKKPVICQVIIENNEVTPEIPLVECPPSTFQIGSQCFQYHIEDETWFVARQICQAQDGDLAQPHDLASLRRELIHRNANWDFWLGGSDIESEGKWTWLSGGDITGPWRRKQPGGGKKENCLDFRRGNIPQINDYKCERKQKFICEFDPIPKKEDINNDLPDCSKWCRPPHFMIGNECFNLVHHSTTWGESQRYCKAEGESLAQPQNLKALSDYLKINIENGAIEGSGIYWLGGYWLHTRKPMGKIWSDVHDMEGDDDCMNIDINNENVISNRLCNTSQPFICQAYPEFWQKIATQEMLVNDLKKVTWSEAEELCQHSDGRLANIYQHDDFVRFMHMTYRFKSFWVGASNINPEVQWQWSSGVSLDPDFPWNNSQLQTDDGLECMQLSYGALDKNPKFVSRDCGEKAYFVCDSKTPETSIDSSIEEGNIIDAKSDNQGEDSNESIILEDNLTTESILPNEFSNDDDIHAVADVTESPQDNVDVTGHSEEASTNAPEFDDGGVKVIIYEVIKEENKIVDEMGSLEEDVVNVTESNDGVNATNHNDRDDENNTSEVTWNLEEGVVNVIESHDDSINTIVHYDNKENKKEDETEVEDGE